MAPPGKRGSRAERGRHVGSDKASLSCGISVLLSLLQVKHSLRRQASRQPPAVRGAGAGRAGRPAGPRGTPSLHQGPRPSAVAGPQLGYCHRRRPRCPPDTRTSLDVPCCNLPIWRASLRGGSRGSGCRVGAGSSQPSPKDDPPQPDHPAECRWLQHDRQSADREVRTSKKAGLTCDCLGRLGSGPVAGGR